MKCGRVDKRIAEN